jgi:hypothetical protein
MLRSSRRSWFQRNEFAIDSIMFVCLGQAMIFIWNDLLMILRRHRHKTICPQIF